MSVTLEQQSQVAKENLRLWLLAEKAAATEGEISVDPSVCGGEPCLAGRRVPVRVILGMLLGGHSFREVADNLPGLDEDEVRAAIRYCILLTSLDEELAYEELRQ